MARREVVFAGLPLLLAGLVSPSWGVRFPEKPPPQDYFVDRTGLIERAA